jgi:hypothetical protein
LDDKGLLKKSGNKFFKKLESNENRNTTNQNMYIQEKRVLKGKFLAVMACIFKKSERSQINNDLSQSLRKTVTNQTQN